MPQPNVNSHYHVAQLVDEVRIVRELELSITVRPKPVRLFDAPDRAAALMPLAREIRSAVPTGGFDRRIGKRQPQPRARLFLFFFFFCSEGRVLSCIPTSAWGTDSAPPPLLSPGDRRALTGCSRPRPLAPA